MFSENRGHFSNTEERGEIRNVICLAWLYAGLTFLKLVLGWFSGFPRTSFLDWLGTAGLVAAFFAGLALLVALWVNASGWAYRACRLIALGHIAYGTAYAGLYEGNWLGYGEVGFQLGTAVFALAIGAWIKANSEAQYRRMR